MKVLIETYPEQQLKHVTLNWRRYATPIFARLLATKMSSLWDSSVCATKLSHNLTAEEIQEIFAELRGGVVL